MATAHFKTGKGQYILPLDVNVEGAANTVFPTGTLVTLVAATSTIPAYIKAAATVDAATHMIALSDETIGGGHIATDLKTYAPSGGVKTTVTDGDASGVSAATVKKVGLYPLFDKGDIICD
jgi:hypothetical protein